MKFRSLAFVLLAACGAAASGADQEEIVVTAARIAQPLSEALPETTVITREQIESQQATDLLELLGRQAGMQLSRLGGPGSQSSLFIRGANSNEVLVLVDGMRLNSPLLGAPNLGGIDTGSIERIEIVRGNLSSLYGSEAIGGVVQIFTRAGTREGAHALAEIGGGHARTAGAGVSGSAGPGLRWNVDAGMREQAAISAMNPAQMPGANPGIDANHNRHASANVQWQGGADTVRAFAFGSRNDTDWDDNFDASFTNFLLSPATAGRIEHSSISALGASATHEGRAASLRADLGESRDDSANESTLPVSYDTNRFSSRSRRAALAGTVHLDGFEWISGVERLQQDGSIVALNADYVNMVYSYPTTSFARHVDSAWTGATGHGPATEWQANLRHDRYSDAGGATTGLLGGGWRWSRAWMGTLQASSAFRAPSFEDLYYPGFGNPKLRPEHSRSLETALRWHDGGKSASFTIFRTRTSDLVQFVNSVPENVARAGMDGWELQVAEAGAGVRGRDGLHWGASLSHLNARDLGTGDALLRRAKWVAQADAGFRSGPWSGGLGVGWNGAREDMNFNPYPPVRVPLASYTLARLTLERELSRMVKLRLRVENALDQHYELAYGFNTVPRMAVLGVEVRT
jgi:vitamin B12 transporter